MGKWLPFDPNPSKVENAEYANEQLNNIMKEYKLNQEKAKVYYEKQKNEKMVKSLTESLSINAKNKKKLEKKVNNMSGKSKERTLSEIKNIENKMKELEEKAKSLKDKYNGDTI
jgi:ABC-type phosphate transport system auxiliary subunit